MKTKKTNLSMEILNENEALEIIGGEKVKTVKRTKLPGDRRIKTKNKN